MLSITGSLLYSKSGEGAFFRAFVDLLRSKDEDHWYAGASNHLFREIGYKVV